MRAMSDASTAARPWVAEGTRRRRIAADLRKISEAMHDLPTMDRDDARQLVTGLVERLEEHSQGVSELGDVSPDEKARAKQWHQMERRAAQMMTEVTYQRIDDAFDPRGYYVYLLWGADREKPVYVGQSSNILCRLGSHMGNPDRREHICRVQLLRCETEQVMLAMEMRLIARHKPEWNDKGKGAVGI